MEEKERYYYKKIFGDCVMPEGLFEIKDRESNFYLIIENKEDVDTITNLLNQQDMENKKLCQQIVDLNKENNKLQKFRDDILRVQAEPYQFYKENQQLKQAQEQLAIDKMTELYDLTDEIYHSNDMDKEWLLDWLKAEIWKLNQEIKLLKEEKQWMK